MKSKLTKRILAVVITAVALAALLAVSSLAAITGGYGSIDGLDAGKNYEAASVTLNSTGDGTAIGTSFTLDLTTNKDLAGLYVVREEGTTDWSDVLYVYGKISDRKALYSRSSTDYYNITDQSFIPEYFYGGYVGIGCTAWGTNSAFGKNGICSVGVQLPLANYQPFYNVANSSTASDTEKQAAFETMAEFLAKSYMHYTFASNEIIPITDIQTYKYSVARQQGVFSYSGQVSEFEVQVVLPSGELKSYVYSHVAADLGPAVTKVVDFTQATSEYGHWNEGLPTEGYVVAFKYHIYANLDDYTKANASSYDAGQRWKFTFDAANDYTIKSPAIAAPTGVTYENGTIKGLDASKKYALVAYNVLGADATNAIEISGVTEFTPNPEKHAGLWALVASVEGYGISAPAVLDESGTMLIYVNGKHSVRSKIGDMDGSTPLAVKKKEADLEWQVGTVVGGNWYSSNPSFVSDWFYYVASPKALREALESGDATKVELLRKQSQDVLQAISYRYAYNVDEIVPISEVVSMKFSRAKQNGVMVVSPATSKLELYVVGTDGQQSVYTMYSEEHPVVGDIGNSSSFETYDIQSFEGLPTEGWLVGYKYYPFGSVALENINPPAGTTSTSGHYAPYVRLPHEKFANSYVIDMPKVPTPTGITVEDTTVKGLDPSLTYGIAPYTLLGADTTKMLLISGDDIADGTYTIDPEKLSGLLGVVIPGDNEYYKESDPVLVYVYGDYASRKEIGEKWQEGDIDLATGVAYTSSNWTGKVKHGSSYDGFAPGYLTHNYTFYTQHNLIGESHFDSAFVRAYIMAESDTERQEIIDNHKSKWLKLVYRYALTTDEVLPVRDIYEFSISTSGDIVLPDKASFTTKDGIFRFIVHVMNEDGSVTKHTADLPYPLQKFNANSPVTFEIDFASTTIWDTAIPQDAYFVGYEYYPFCALTKVENFEIVYKGEAGTTPTGDGYRARCQAFLPKWTIKENAPKPSLSSFPVIDGGYGEISGLDPQYLYEARIYNEETGKWSQWIDVPVGSTAYRVTEPGLYGVRVKETEDYVYSETAEIEVLTYNAEYPPFDSQIVTMHLPNDFVELTAEYEMDVTVKNWVSTLALENIKTVSPKSTITIFGEDYKFIIVAEKINLDDTKAHYIDMTVSFDGESRFDKDYESLKALAGEKYVTEVYFESSIALPFEEAQFWVFVGDDMSGNDVQLRSYNSRINKLRNVETATVIDGWATFSNYALTYVIIEK